MQAESTKLEYDFENIQAVLQDKILFEKIIIDTSSGVSNHLNILKCFIFNLYNTRLMIEIYISLCLLLVFKGLFFLSLKTWPFNVFL